MKALIALLALNLLCSGLQAQLKATRICPAIYVDILDGKVNGLEPDFTQGQIKKSLPCFTSEEAETENSRCGGAVLPVATMLK